MKLEPLAWLVEGRRSESRSRIAGAIGFWAAVAGCKGLVKAEMRIKRYGGLAMTFSFWGFSVFGVIGPWVSWVAAGEFFSHLWVAIGPEAFEVFGHLPWFLSGREDVNEKGDVAVCDGWGFPNSEEV